MAVDTFAPQLFATQAERLLHHAYVWPMLANDHSDYFSTTAADRLTLPDFEGSVSVGDYTKYTDITYTQMNDAQYVLLLDQAKLIAKTIDDLDVKRNFMGLAAQASEQGMRELSAQYNNNIRAEYTQSIPTANKHTISARGKGANAGAGVHWGTADHRSMVIDSFDEAREFASMNAWPADARFCVTGTAVYTQLYNFLIVDKPNLGVGSIVDDAFTGAKIMMIKGFRVYEDTLDQDDPSVAGTDKNRLHFGLAGQSVHTASQMKTAEAFRNHNQSGTLIRSLWLHGAVAGSPRKRYFVEHDIATS